jgi:hypothetical protein
MTDSERDFDFCAELGSLNSHPREVHFQYTLLYLLPVAGMLDERERRIVQGVLGDFHQPILSTASVETMSSDELALHCWTPTTPISPSPVRGSQL